MVVVVTFGVVVVRVGVVVVTVGVVAVVVVAVVLVVPGGPLRVAVVLVVVDFVFPCAGFLESTRLFRVPDADAGSTRDVLVCEGSPVARVDGRRTEPPHSVVLSRALASEWWMSSSQPVSATLPIRKAAAVVPSTRRHRAGMRRLQAVRLTSASLRPAKCWRAAWVSR